MATDYPIEITDPDGSVRIAGLADFTDPDNQPGLVANPPFHAAETGSTAIMVDSPDGDSVIDFDADEPKIDMFYDTDFGGNNISNAGGLAINAAGAGLVAAGDASIGGDGKNIGFLGAALVGVQTIDGALSTVLDAAAKDVLTSIIASMVAYGLAVDGTT